MATTRSKKAGTGSGLPLRYITQRPNFIGIWFAVGQLHVTVLLRQNYALVAICMLLVVKCSMLTRRIFTSSTASTTSA